MESFMGIFMLVGLILIIFLYNVYKCYTEEEWICLNCGFRGNRKKITKGSSLIELILWICLIVPGLIYSIWRITTKFFACPKCNTPNMIPIDSPKGKELLQKYGIKE